MMTINGLLCFDQRCKKLPTCTCHADYVQVTDLPVSGLFFAIGHEPATKFLDGQLRLDSENYIVTEPGALEGRHIPSFENRYVSVVLCSCCPYVRLLSQNYRQQDGLLT